MTLAQQFPGSARVSRAGFGVSPKQSSQKSSRKRDAFASTRDARATQSMYATRGSFS